MQLLEPGLQWGRNKQAQQNRAEKSRIKHTAELAQIKSKEVYSCEIRLKPFSIWAPWGNSQNQKSRTMTTTTTTPWSHRHAELIEGGLIAQPRCWAACACSTHTTSDTSPEGTELFTGNHLLQGPCLSSPPSPGRVPFPPHLSSEAYLAPGLAVQKAHPGWNLKPRDSQTLWLGQTVPPPILELNFREFWFYLYRG